LSPYISAAANWLYALMAFFGIAALLFMLRAIRTGAMADDESPKYRMLEDDLPSPGAAASGRGGSNDHRA